MISLLSLTLEDEFYIKYSFKNIFCRGLFYKNGKKKKIDDGDLCRKPPLSVR